MDVKCIGTSLRFCCHLLKTRLVFGFCDVELVLVEFEFVQQLLRDAQLWGIPGTSSCCRVSVELAGAIFKQRHQSVVRPLFGRAPNAGVWMPSHRQGLC